MKITQIKAALLAVIVIILIQISLSFACAGSFRIMPLGDSITLGYSVTVQNNNFMVSYRQKLYLDLVNNGYEINFVGSLSSGMSIQPSFDVNHEGHGGWCADACDPPYEGLREHIYDFLVANHADVVLLHIGTNDIGMNLQDPNAVIRVLDEIYRYSPNITVILARIISRTDGKVFQTIQFNNAVEALAGGRPEYGETLFLVDMEHALNYPADMDDALHPNQTGYEKMANVWLEALYNILPLPTRLLTVQKSDEAQGEVTSIPEAIDCGISCTASFIYGAVVNLTATAKYGSVLSHWTGCDSVDGNICTVTLDSNRIVTANFDIVYKDLTIQKAGTGQGTLTSLPSAIDCGSTCSASLPQGAVVNLTATADYGSTFFNWTDCDSVNGNTCTITLGSNRTVMASFSLVTEVKLLSPKGGEIIPAGSEYPISWEAPPGAVTFKFITTCSGQRVSVNTFTGNDAMWGIPLFSENKTGCLSKIKAYNAYGTKIGSDISDGTFMIAGARITFPNQGTICTGGQTCTVTWTKSEYVPAASSELSYSLNAGWTWTKIPDLLPGDAKSFDWMALDVSKPKTNCKVKVVLRDSDGKIVGRDKSDGTFTIQP